MEVLSVVDSGIGIGGQRPLGTDVLVDTSLDDSLLSSIGAEQNGGKVRDTLVSNYPESTRDSEAGQSESKDSGIKLEKTESGSPTLSNEKRPSQTAGGKSQVIKARWGSNKLSSEKNRSASEIQQQHGTWKTAEPPPFDVNPEAVPFLPQNFMSSTVLKKIAVPKRHLDTFGGMEYNVTGRRGVILHTDRYHWASFQPFDGMSQRDRLIAELTYMEKLRGVKRRREVLPHRAQLDLVMGGRKIEIEERFDINREIQKLKSLVLPKHARDLYHGRGIILPGDHSSLKPRGHPYDISEEVSASAPALLHTGLGDGPSFLGLNRRQPTQPTFLTSSATGATPRMKRRGQLPSLGKRNDSPVLLSREKRTVTNLQARLYLPRTLKDESYPAIKSRHAVLPSVEASSLNRSPAAWVADQNRRILEGGGHVEVPAPPIVEDKTKQSSVADSDTDMDHTDTEHGRTASPGTRTKTVTSPRLTESTGEGRVPGTHAAHPLKGAELVESVPLSERDQLRATFQRLDTDMDGSLNYTQLKSQLPEDFSPAQEVFVKHVYDLTRSSSSLFGIEDFMNMTQLTQALAALEGAAMTAFQSLDSQDRVEEVIKQFVELFQQVDRSSRGKISPDSVRSILTTALDKELGDELWTNIKNVMGIGNSPYVSKLEFLAHIPYFQSLEGRS